MGRPRKPTALRGIAGGKKSTEEPKPKPASVRMPAGMSPAERSYWRRLAPDLIAKGVLTAWDVDAFKDLCIIRARKDAADQDIAERGILVEGRDGLVRNPAVMIASQASLEAARLGARFGLSPSDRAALHVARPKLSGLEEFLEPQGLQKFI